jgi:hypothetical protein
MPGVLDQEEFLLEPDPSIQQPVPFTHPVPEYLGVLSIFCGGNATLWQPAKRIASNSPRET